MKPTKPINEWKNVFLDTSFIIDYLSNNNQFIKDALTRERREIVHKVMDIFAQYELTGEKQRRNFFISTLTITELRKLSTSKY